jgi:hypothetical protein
MNLTTMVRTALLVCLAAGSASAAQLITNGGFETGNFSAWTVTDEAGSYLGDTFYALSSMTTPQSSSLTAGPESGTHYAVSDGLGPGAAALTESFVVPVGATSVILSYGLFVNSAAGTDIDSAADLSFSGAANQYALVSLLSAGASVFTTTTGDLKNFYQGTDSGSLPNGYTDYSYNITSLVTGGGTFTIRFAEVNNLDVLNMGVDNVSVVSTTGGPVIPEPSSLALALFGIAGIAAYRLRTRPAVALR